MNRTPIDAKPAQEGFWYRLSRFVMRRPLPIATLSALFLIVLGLPFLGIKFNTVDPTVLPESSSARQAYDTVSTAGSTVSEINAANSATSAPPRPIE